MQAPQNPLESIQHLIARLLATSPAGQGLCLIGGFRFRLLDGSSRSSMDLDYHYDGDLAERSQAVADLLTRKLLSEVKRRWDLDGHVDPRPRREDDGTVARTIRAVFHRTRESGSRIEVPVEITRICLADRPEVRTIAGTVYLTASDADMIEAKVIALFSRPFVEDRDLLDLFLHATAFRGDSPLRLRDKLSRLGMAPSTIARSWKSLLADREVHCRALDRIIQEQVDDATAVNLRAGGGGPAVFTAAITRVGSLLGLETGDPEAGDEGA